MGNIILLGENNASQYKTLKNAPGQSLVLKLEGVKDDILNAEYYQNSGIFSRPPKNVKTIIVPISGNSAQSVVIGMHNYNLNININEGATTVYSTDSDGQEIKAKMLFDSDGKVGINNAQENIKNLIDQLIDAIIAIITEPIPIPPGPPFYTLTPASVAALNTVKSNFANLLKDI